LTVNDLAQLGARRISVGGTLARCAWGGFVRAAKEIASEGRFDAFADAAPHADINGFFRGDLEKRTSAADA
jgi:2-methylisocitrate lyase-like PEP mutase family enzyme